MKLDIKQINQLLDEMESVLHRIQKISSEFCDSVDSKKQQQEYKKAA